MSDGPFSGTWFVLPTPFDDDGAVDLPGQRRVVEAAIGWGVDGLLAMGVTGEAAALTPEERRAALEVVLDAAGGSVPVVVGCSAGSAEAAAGLVREAASLGAAGAMVAAPPLVRDADSLPAFFARVADEGGLPMVVQDEPAATGVLMPVSVLAAIVDAAGARTVKLEDPPTPPKIARLLAARPGLAVFGGLGGLHALAELRRGACGTMTGFAFPEVLAAVRLALEAGDQDRAARVFDRYLPLIAFEAQPGAGLAIRKELLRRRGAIASAVTRGRAREVDPVTSAELDELLARMGIEPSLAALRITARA